ncbi:MULTISPECIES: DUF1456 family protein [Peribacillus]|uniref:DUF1456 family protein n=1 Tax=Peribacillus TaxID=2675229 RepID=UPI000B68A290|nr:DUF1456 family protein [Peribacillus simplex]MDF9763522.1 uncharacterized protein YehS (DUF1456 family) [Peribacillus simplex]SNT05757.1 Uncharacterized conserved protein YehS, DUF1456 family [Bacillus sp. OK838]
MHNHDILIRLRYALDIKNKDMVEIFKLGDIEVTREEVMQMLTKPKDGFYDEYDEDDMDDEGIKCNNTMLESFLNGLIIFKRGKQEPKPGQPENPAPTAKNKESMNNILLKKMKIALTLTSEDMIDILEEAGVMITKGELSAILRKVGHRNYKECGDKFARNFLKGLALRYRG